jgi:ribosomal-protein-alanine N-acetyltransferase
MQSSNRNGVEVASAFGPLRLGPIEPAELTEVLEIERQAFPAPWQRVHFLHEMQFNPAAFLRRLCLKGHVLAYACMWNLPAELRINNLTVRADHRRSGLAGLLLRCVLDEGRERGCARATLEVRPSNVAARELYRAHGFVETGRRVNYYADEGEDAILMQLEPLVLAVAT